MNLQLFLVLCFSFKVLSEQIENNIEEDLKPITEVNSNPIIEEDSNPITEEDSNPIIEEDSNPITEEDSNPITEEDSNPIIEEDSNPIIEDTSKIDLSKLEVISRTIRLRQDLGFECEHLKEEEIIYRYDALTASGEREEVKLVDVKQLPVEVIFSSLSNVDDLTLVGNKTVVPYYNCFTEMDHPYLLNEIEKMIYPPSTEEYNFKDLDYNMHGETDHPGDVDRIVFGGQLRNGFFIEAGSVDSETYSDTLYFEIKYNWTGLLVEPMPLEFAEGLRKHRKAYSIQTCFSTETKPQIVEFDPEAVLRDDSHSEIRLSMGGIVLEPRNTSEQFQCMPFYSVLLAIGNPTVHWISLDIEGAEFAVLKTVPWDKVDIQSMTVETHMLGSVFPGDRKEFIAYMDSVGYRHIQDAHQGTNELREKLGTIDDLFVRKDIPLAEERLSTPEKTEL